MKKSILLVLILLFPYLYLLEFVSNFVSQSFFKYQDKKLLETHESPYDKPLSLILKDLGY